MLYYYAYSGHKIGLDRVKRAAALLKQFQAQGIETRLLVNDFRAGLAAKEFGVRDSVTIETIQDIDAMAQIGDSIIIDSPEDDHGRLQKYCVEYKAVFRFAQNKEDESCYGETMLKMNCEDDACLPSVIIDDIYFEPAPKEERTLFFLGDADYDKVLLSQKAFFADNPMELLLGHYFFVKYEDELSRMFTKLHEAEEYTDLIRSSSHIVTASAQTALEAKASGADVVFIRLDTSDPELSEYLTLKNISIIDGFDIQAYQKIQEANTQKADLPQNGSAIAKKIINTISF
ncbi:MAG: hypothetical protein IE885_01050 [Campylobacterales bacterium]|nr:hypothetical protein [Campylobacterales bacterium]